MADDYNKKLQRRLARQKAFHAGRAAGDLLVYAQRWGYANLELFLCEKFHTRPPQEVLDPSAVGPMIADYVQLLRQSYPLWYRYDDDALPCAIVYAGIGVCVAAMTALTPIHTEQTSWLEPNLSWQEIAELKFDPQNPWIQFAEQVNHALWHHWEEDFLVLPFLHRSPLDAANGLRGTVLFEEMYTYPDKVKALINSCADWSIAIERHLAQQVKHPQNCATGVWETWLPDGAVFVNGDPVGLISPEMMLEFEQPFTEKLFTSTGGGFFHNHTVGLYQVSQVSRTRGLLVQEFIVDPKQPNVPDVLLENSNMRDTILEASLKAPIMMEDVPLEQVEPLLPILKKGRFIVSLLYDENQDPTDAVAAIRQISNLY